MGRNLARRKDAARTRDVGRALTPDEETRLFDACCKSPQPSLYTAVVVFCNTGLRNAELRRARWSQVDFLKAEFQVGEAKKRAAKGASFH